MEIFWLKNTSKASFKIFVMTWVSGSFYGKIDENDFIISVSFIFKQSLCHLVTVVLIKSNSMQ